MAKKVESVEEVLESIKAKENKAGKKVTNRFSKKNFNRFLRAIINDPNYASDIVTVKGDEVSVETLMVSKEFRKFLQHVVEKAGVDKSESVRVFNEDFTLDTVDGLYELISEGVYRFLEAGNKFDFLAHADCAATISLADVAEVVKVKEAFTPGTAETRKSLGVFETTYKEHKEIKVKSSTPKWLKQRKAK